MSRKEYEEMTTGAGPVPEAPKAPPRKVSHVSGHLRFNTKKQYCYVTYQGYTVSNEKDYYYML